MPNGVYKNTGCDVPSHAKEYTPMEHQKKTVEFFYKSKERGLLLYHKLGSGKTCTAIAIADKLLQKGKVDHVYVFTPGSLRKIWIAEYCEKCGFGDMMANFTFITYNYGSDVKKINFDNSLVIIDEAHNFAKHAFNRADTVSVMYDKLVSSNCKIVLLTGTPVSKNWDDLAVLLYLLKPEEIVDVRPRKKGKRPSASLDSYFSVYNDKIVPIFKEKLNQMFSNVISYYPGPKVEYARVEHMSAIRVQMSPEQNKDYWLARDLEKTLIAIDRYDEGFPRKVSKEILIACISKIFSRAISNFCYIPLVGEELEKIRAKRLAKKQATAQRIKDMGFEVQIPAGETFGFLKHEFPDKLMSEGGWISEETLEGGYLWKCSKKVVALIYNIARYPNEKHIIYTMFKNFHGANLIHTLLKLADIESLVFSGDTSDNEREAILATFNNKKNSHGQKYPIIILTDAGAEGITIKDVRHIHIFESASNDTKIQQTFGRAVRYGSHDNLPLEERTVKIWRYFSVSDGAEILVEKNKKGKKVAKNIVPTDEAPVDEWLYEVAKEKRAKVDMFLEIVQSYSVL